MSDANKCMYLNSTYDSTQFSMLGICKINLVPCNGPERRTNFEFGQLGEFEIEYEKNVVIDMKISRYSPFKAKFRFLPQKFQEK